ncbi:MAG: ABC transporter ATP-binding protein [Clostridia bacterium]|nr:ABC transporter ATP-binding protein [Clostridia bacterium]
MSLQTLKKVLKYLGKYKILLFISVLLSAVWVILTQYVPILVGKAIDKVVGIGNVDLAGVVTVLIEAVIITGIVALLQWITGTLNNKITFGVVKDIRTSAFNKIQQLPIKYIDSHPGGEIVSRIISDTEQFADGLLLGFTQLFTGVVTIITTLVFLFTLSWQTAVAVMLLTPLSLFVANFIAKRTYSMFKRQSETRGEQTALIDEMISGAKTVKAFSREKHVEEKFNEINARLEEESLKATFFSSLTNPSTRFINSVVYACVALLGGLMAIFGGGMTVGGLSCCLNYANQYTKPFNEISSVITEIQNAFACASRVFELIEEPPRSKDGDEELTDVEGVIELENVSFAYSKERPLIQNLNLSVASGKRVAIVGPTGCGKTTLINLLMRFYDVDEGAISVDGKNINQVTRKSLRTSYGMVLQETWLKSGTIKENIAFGKEDATDEEIIAAAKAAHAHTFIKRMPNGYDTVIGEDGGSLSQGQKQLLCIARIMLSLPPMLILDEATSSIDTRTEQKIQSAFQKMMQGRTSFIVAHRLSTIESADVILVMKDGNVIEQGTHKELLDKKGFYFELYNSQFEQA